MKSAETTSRSWLRSYKVGDSTLWITIFALICVGLVMVYSASFIQAHQLHNDGFHFLRRHFFFLLIGGFAFFIGWRIKIAGLKKMVLPLYGLALVGLVLTFVPGLSNRSGGASRWLSLGGLTFQPSEFAKIAVLLFLARQVTRKMETDDRDRFASGFLAFFAPVLPVYVLLLMQPDFGTTALLVASTVCVMIACGTRLKHLFMGGALLIPILGTLVLTSPYRMKRIFGFLDPWSDPSDKGFQVIQSLLAFYNGRLFGVGVGNSHEKLFYLPKAHNDFIFAVVGEEWGLFGVVFLLGLFLVILWRGLSAADRQLEPFRKALTVGLTSLIGLQAFFNMAVVLGLLPTKGLPLPLISYGGSSLVMMLLMLGLLLQLAEDR